MPFGIVPTGFAPKPLEDIQADLDSGFRGVFGAAITTVAQSVFGQLIGIMSDRLADLWQLGLALYNASFRAGAVGVQLDNIGDLTGTVRRPASNTKVSLTLGGVNGTVIGAGRVVSIPATGTKFTSLTGGTISGGVLALEFQAVETGPKVAYAGTVTQIDTPVSGWNTVTNPLDHSILGADVETDAAYRIRQVRELRAQGKATIAAILAAVFASDSNVVDAFVFENESDVTDAQGLPPHSFEVVAFGGTDAHIAKAIIDTKATGIASHGTTTVATTDANGFARNVKLSRPVALDIYADVTVTVNAATFPDNGDAQIKDAMAAYGDLNLRTGSEVRSSAFLPSVFGITGVLESTLPLISTAPSPASSTTIVVTNRQRAEMDTSRIAVHVIKVSVE